MQQQCAAKGLLIVISGPSGVGKGTIFKELIKREPQIRFSVSATTRAPRPGEIDGVHYYFISNEEFKRMEEAGEFLEYTNVFGTNRYGTPKKYVYEQLDAGEDVALDIDVVGAMNVMREYPEAVTVFIAPPSLTTLKARLVGRHTESPKAIERRFERAHAELDCAKKYDYIVINDRLDDAVSQVQSIITAEHLRASRRAGFIQKIATGGTPT